MTHECAVYRCIGYWYGFVLAENGDKGVRSMLEINFPQGNFSKLNKINLNKGKWFCYIFYVCHTRCGAPNNLKIAPICVAKGVPHANEYVGARDGIGYITMLYGSVSAKYCTRMGNGSSGSIFNIIFSY